MFKLLLSKFLKIGKERLIIALLDAIADLALDIRRNGYDDRKRNTDTFQGDDRFNDDINRTQKRF